MKFMREDTHIYVYILIYTYCTT